MAQTCAKLESNTVVVGINVSKDHPDAAQYPSGDLIQTSNDTKGLRTLLRWIGRQRAVHVVFEATGPFHRQLESHLAKAGIPFSRINPRQARKLSKTDRVGCVILGAGDVVCATANAGMPPSKTKRGRINFAVRTGLPWLAEQ